MIWSSSQWMNSMCQDVKHVCFYTDGHILSEVEKNKAGCQITVQVLIITTVIYLEDCMAVIYFVFFSI